LTGVRPSRCFASIADCASFQLEHKLKIELVTDGDELSTQTTKEQSNIPPSLLSRIAGPLTQAASDVLPKFTADIHIPQRPVMKKSTTPVVVSAPRKRAKKGPKRVKKSLAQLDQEMDEYRASATNGNSA